MLIDEVTLKVQAWHSIYKQVVVDFGFGIGSESLLVP